MREQKRKQKSQVIYVIAVSVGIRALSVTIFFFFFIYSKCFDGWNFLNYVVMMSIVMDKTTIEYLNHDKLSNRWFNIYIYIYIYTGKLRN